LKTVFYPFLPFSSEKLHYMLGFAGDLREVGWKIQYIPPGQKLARPEPLFVKLEENIIAQETDRLGFLNEKPTSS